MPVHRKSTFRLNLTVSTAFVNHRFKGAGYGRWGNEHGERDPVYDFRLRVKVQIQNEFKYADVASFLDALSEKWVFVDSSRTSSNPPAAGALETMITIVLTGEVANVIWHMFFSEIIEEAGRNLQSKMRDLIHRGTTKPNHKTHPPVSIICGKVRLYITVSVFSEHVTLAGP